MNDKVKEVWKKEKIDQINEMKLQNRKQID